MGWLSANFWDLFAEEAPRDGGQCLDKHLLVTRRQVNSGRPAYSSCDRWARTIPSTLPFKEVRMLSNAIVAHRFPLARLCASLKPETVLDTLTGNANTLWNTSLDTCETERCYSSCLWRCERHKIGSRVWTYACHGTRYSLRRQPAATSFLRCSLLIFRRIAEAKTPSHASTTGRMYVKKTGQQYLRVLRPGRTSTLDFYSDPKAEAITDAELQLSVDWLQKSKFTADINSMRDIKTKEGFEIDLVVDLSMDIMIFWSHKRKGIYENTSISGAVPGTWTWYSDYWLVGAWLETVASGPTWES